MRRQRRGLWAGWRLPGLWLIGWIILGCLCGGDGPLRTAAADAPAQEVFAPVRPLTMAQSSPPRYLIIAPDEFAPLLAGYVAAKQAEGYEVVVKSLSQTGSTAAQIRAAILADSPRFLLLVGDVEWLPAWQSRAGLSTSTDLYYATLGGAWDFTPDLEYARLPVHSTDELQAVLTKWDDYRALDGSQPHLSRAAFIAGGLANESVHNEMIEQYTEPVGFEGYFPNNPQPGGDRLYVHSYAADKDDLAAALNGGRGLAVYFGQGSALGWISPYFTVSDVQALIGPPLPLLVSFAGRTAELSPEQTSFGEAWLLSSASGALAVIAPASETTPSADERLEKEWFKALFASLSPSLPVGEALRQALQQFSEYYMSGELIVQQYYEMYSLWGDPTQRLWLDAPQPFSLTLEPGSLSVCSGAAASLPVQVNLASRLTRGVTLSLRNAPQGVSGTFSPNPAESPGSAALTLAIPADLPAGDYPLTVQGVSGAVQQTAALSLTVRPAAPSNKPQPLLPANGAIQVGLRPQLSWSAVSGADGYDVQLGLDAAFEQTVAVFEEITQTTFTLSQDLQPNQTYYWRVRARNGCGVGDFSFVAQFTTLPSPRECPAGSLAETVYGQSFDAAPAGWHLQNGWQIGSTFGRSGVAHAAAPAEIRLQTLTSPLLSLPGEADVLAVELRAEMAYDFGEPPACLDGGLLEISTDDGKSWARLAEEAIRVPAYEGNLAVSFGNPRAGERAWCHQRDWSRLVADLSAFRGQDVRLRFMVATGADEQSTPGLALDNFEVAACRAESPVRGLGISPVEQSAILPAGAAASFVWQVSNTGGQSEPVEISVSGDLPAQLSPSSFVLNTGESQEIRVEVGLPDSAAPAAEYRLDVVAHSGEEPSIWAAATLNLTVQQCGLLLSAPSDVPPLVPGAPTVLQLILTNTGNASDAFNLTVENPANWTVDMPTEAVQIQEQDSTFVDLTIRVPENATPGESHSLRVIGRSAACPAVAQSLERRLVVQGSRLFLPLIGR